MSVQSSSRQPSAQICRICPPEKGPCPECPLEGRKRTGVLLVNLGTPHAPSRKAVRQYLAEFLRDRRVIDFPRIFWLPVLYGLILNLRPGRAARSYAAIWDREHDESPLRVHTRMLAGQLAENTDNAMVIEWAMRYGGPSVAEGLDSLRDKGCGRILVVPLYPQYSASTTASVADAVFRATGKMRWQPALRFAPPFHDAPAYIDALKKVTAQYTDSLDWVPEKMLISYHGLPERYVRAGDPYYRQCIATTRLLRNAMGWSGEFSPMAFQSKFGPEKWLAPATDDMLARLASSGVRRLAVVMPGFMADCIETLEEIAIEARRTFLEAGGEQFGVVPCLNATPEATGLMTDLVRKECAGWQA